jgi:SAM-dependent methyltransferase
VGKAIYFLVAILALLALAVISCAHRSRRAELELLSEALLARPGATIADIGAGEGQLAVALAELVGPGRVYASEIDEDKRRDIERRARRGGLGNVVVIAAGESETGLAAGCCDAILTRGVYHHLTRPSPILAGIFEALKPGGRFVVIDFPPSRLLSLWKVKGVPGDRGGHGVRSDIVVREALGAGFEHVETIEDWPGLWPLGPYAVVFRKPLLPGAGGEAR